MVSFYVKLFGGEVLMSFVFYHFVSWKLFTYSEKNKKLTPKQCLMISSSTISIIHSIICCFGAYDFVSFKRWTNPLIDEPRLAGHLVSFGTGYMLADGLSHCVCFFNYNSTIIPRTWDIIIHHVVDALFGLIQLFPNPIYLWNPLSIACAMEFSTIFLNLQWFGKHFKNNKLERISQLLFIFAWFVVRLPICGYVCYWFIRYNKHMYDKVPLQLSIAATLVIIVAVMILQLLWTFVIIWKIINHCCFQSASTARDTIQSMATKPPHMIHGVSTSIHMFDS